MQNPNQSDRKASEASHRLLPTLGLLPILAVSAAAVATPVFAQESTTELDTVTISGGQGGEGANSFRVTNASSTKVTAPLLDTPKTVQVITQKEIEERGASSLYDVLRTTPGVTIGTGEGGNPMGDRPFIRGYEASTDMMVDGVRSLGRTSHEAFNVESIELTKGATGAYSGRGGAGGSLNMVSKQARIGEAFNHLSATVGTDNLKRASVDSNFALGANAAARVNLYLQDGEVAGRGGLRDDKKGLAAAFTTRLGDATTLSANAYYSKSESTPDFGIPMANDGYVQRWQGTAGYEHFGSGTSADPYLPIGSLNHEAFYGLKNRDFRENTNRNFSLKLNHDFSNSFRVSAQLSRITSDQSYIVTRPTLIDSSAATVANDTYGYFDRANRNGHRKTETTAFNLNFSGEANLAGLEHSYAFGLEVLEDKLRSGSYSGIPSTPIVTDWAGIQNPDSGIPVDMSGLTRGPLGGATVTKSKSLYFADTVKFNEQWQANFGLRYEMFDVRNPDSVNNNTGVVTPGLRRKDNIWSSQFGVVYKPAVNGSIYASYSTSASPSGQCASLAGGSEGAGACTLTNGNKELEPEKIRAYEIGTKWNLFSDQLSLTAALFRTEKTNARATDPITNTVELIGKNRAQGIELGVAGQINHKWAISGGYTYTDAKIINGGGNGSTNGNEMHYIAPHSFSLWTTYAVTDQWTVGGGATYQSERFMDAANTRALPSQWRVDLMTSYKINDKASVQLNVNNIFDEDLYDASHVGLFANLQARRNATLKIDYRF